MLLTDLADRGSYDEVMVELCASWIVTGSPWWLFGLGMSLGAEVQKAFTGAWENGSFRDLRL